MTPLSSVVQAILVLTGMPRAVTELRQHTATEVSVFWLARLWDFGFAPMIVLKRNIAVLDSQRL